MKKLIVSLLCIAALSACDNKDNKDNVVTPPVDTKFDKEIVFGASRPASRISLGPDGTTLDWVVGDRVNVFMNDAAASVEYTVASVASDGSAVLEGSLKWYEPETSHTFRAYHNGTVYQNKYVSIPGQNYTTESDTDNYVKNSMLVVAVPVSVDSPSAEGEENPPVSLTFKKVMSIMEFRLASFVEDTRVESIVVETENAVFPTDGKVDITATGNKVGVVEFSAELCEKTATLSVSNYPAVAVTGTEIADEPTMPAPEGLSIFRLPIAAVGDTGALTITVTTNQGEFVFERSALILQQGAIYPMTMMLNVDTEPVLAPLDAYTDTDGNVLGMIIAVNTDNNPTLVMSIDEYRGGWTAEADKGITLGFTGTETREEMITKLQTLRPTNWQERFPSYAWCYNHAGGDWDMPLVPDCLQIYQLYSQDKVLFNQKLTAMGGTEIKATTDGKQYYWTRGFEPGKGLIYYAFYNGNTNFTTNKMQENNLRAVLRLN
jgi:hypothetical protein